MAVHLTESTEGTDAMDAQAPVATDDAGPQFCSSCGTTPPPGDEGLARLTWSLGTDHGRSGWTCDRCSRDNLRSIETKLDSDWW